MNNTQRVTVELKNGHFHIVGTDKAEKLNPKAMILCAAAECAGWTVMNLLGKEDITPKSFEITAWGELNTPTLQAESIFTKFMMIYNIKCDYLSEQGTIGEAVRRAQEKHCGVVAMLRKIAPVDHDISIISIE